MKRLGMLVIPPGMIWYLLGVEKRAWSMPVLVHQRGQNTLP